MLIGLFDLSQRMVPYFPHKGVGCPPACLRNCVLWIRQLPVSRMLNPMQYNPASVNKIIKHVSLGFVHPSFTKVRGIGVLIPYVCFFHLRDRTSQRKKDKSVNTRELYSTEIDGDVWKIGKQNSFLYGSRPRICLLL